MLVGHPTAAASEEVRRLALLIAAPWEGETAMHNDLVATYTVLRQRGFAPEEFLVLEGPLTRSLLLAFLQDVHRRIREWPQGNVWFFFSGHGTLRGTTAADAQAGLLFTSAVHPSPEDQMWWEDVFAACRCLRRCSSSCSPIPDTRICWPAGCRPTWWPSCCRRCPAQSSRAGPGITGSSSRAVPRNAASSPTTPPRAWGRPQRLPPG